MGQLPGQHLATPPGDDRHQIHKALGHVHIRDIRTPHLRGTAYHHRAEQRRVDLMGVGGRTRPWLGRDRLQPHGPHEPLDSCVVDRRA
jgi:hypothetical protein